MSIPPDKKLVIMGAGGHATVVASTLMALKRHIDGYITPEPSSSLSEKISWLGDDAILEKLDPETILLVNGIGSTGSVELKRRVFENAKKYGFSFVPLIHPSAILDDSILYGEGVQIMAGTIVQPNVTIEDNVLLNTGCIIDHDTHIASHCHVAPGVSFSGGVQIGDSVHIGTGAVLKNGIKVGAKAIIGAGAVVIRDVKEKDCIAGNPAQSILSGTE